MLSKFRNNINVYINYLAVVLAFGIGFAKFLVPVAGILIIFLWLMEGNFKEKFGCFKKRKSFIVFSVFLIYLFLTLFISADIGFYDTTRHFWAGKHLTPQLWYLKHYVFFFLVVAALATSINKVYVKYILAGFIAGMLINVITSYLIFFHIIKPILNVYNGATPFFINHSYYSAFLAVSIFTLLIMIKNGMFNRKFLGFLLALFLFNLFINNGRIGQLMFLVGSVISFFYFARLGWKKNSALFIGLIAALFLIYEIIPVFKNTVNRTLNSFQSVKKDYFHTPVGERIALDIVGVEIVKKYPLFGVGIDEAMNAKNRYVTKHKKWYFLHKYLHFHNNYIQYTVEGGLVGLALFLLFFVSLLFEKVFGIGKDIKFLIIPLFFVFALTEVPFLRDRSFALFILFYSVLLSSTCRETSNIEMESA